MPAPEPSLWQIIGIVATFSGAAFAASSALTNFQNRRTANKKALAELIKDILSLRLEMEAFIEKLHKEKITLLDDGVDITDRANHYINETNELILIVNGLKDRLDLLWLQTVNSFRGPPSDIAEMHSKLISEVRLKFSSLTSHEMFLGPFSDLAKKQAEQSRLEQEHDALIAEREKLVQDLEAARNEIKEARAKTIRLSQEAVQMHLNAIPKRD